jgi:O-antigen/teichoic acid export membrane protein
MGRHGKNYRAYEEGLIRPSMKNWLLSSSFVEQFISPNQRKRFNLSLLADFLWFSGANGFSQLFNIVYSLLLARWLLPESYGILAGCYAVVSLSSIIVNIGLDTWLLREPRSLAAPRAWSGRILRIKFVFGIFWVILLITILPLVKPDIFSRGLVFICALDILCDAALTTHTTILNIQKRIRIVSRLIFFSRLSRLLFPLLIILISSTKDPLWFAFLRFTSTFGSLLVAIWILKPDIKAPDTLSSGHLIREAIPYGISDFLVLIYMQADVTLVTLLNGSAAAGIYSPASGLVNALFIIPSSIYLLIIPILSRQFVKNPNVIQLLNRILTIGFACLGLGLCLCVGFLGEPLIHLLLGDKYQLTASLLVILSPLLLIKSLSFAWAAILVTIGWQKQRLIPQAISAAVNILLNIWAIPIFGVLGAAIVYVFTEIVLAVGYGGLVFKWLHLLPLPIEENK